MTNVEVTTPSLMIIVRTDSHSVRPLNEPTATQLDPDDVAEKLACSNIAFLSVQVGAVDDGGIVHTPK